MPGCEERVCNTRIETARGEDSATKAAMPGFLAEMSKVVKILKRHLCHHHLNFTCTSQNILDQFFKSIFLVTDLATTYIPKAEGLANKDTTLCILGTCRATSSIPK